MVRCFRGNAELLGIDRDAEHANTVAAAGAGVGAPVVDYRPDLGVLVIEFLHGTTFDNASFSDPGAVERAGRAVRRLHDGPRFSGDFDMLDRQRRYLDLVHTRGCSLPDGYESHDAAYRRVGAALAVHPATTVPCNTDLLWRRATAPSAGSSRPTTRRSRPACRSPASCRSSQDFLGRAAVEAARAAGPRRRLVSFVVEDPEPMLWGGELVLRDGVAVGQVTSAV